MLATLRASSAALAAIITASATWAITRPFSRRPPRPSIPPLRILLNAPRRSPRHNEMMGMSMTSKAATMAITMADVNTRQSGAADSAHAPSGSASMTTRKADPGKRRAERAGAGRHEQHFDDDLLRQPAVASPPVRNERRTPWIAHRPVRARGRRRSRSRSGGSAPSRPAWREVPAAMGRPDRHAPA